MNFSNLKYLVVGSGFFGSVIAERIANDLNESVMVIDKKDHIGGNCYSQVNKNTGIEYHVYGTHIFHTDNQEVWDYINKFTDFNSYRHQVLTTFKDKVYQMPINLETINSFYNVNLRPFQVNDFLKDEIAKENIKMAKNLEEKAISLVGRPLYEAFIKGYTTKQWQKDPKELPAFIIERLPIRRNYNENYYFDNWQGIPTEGYSNVFKKILSNEKIEVCLNTDFFEIKDNIPESCLIIYTGPLDKLFNFKHGKLDWRGLKFKEDVLDIEDYQGTAVMNYAEDSVPYTRIHEPRHLHIERNYNKKKTLIIKEYSKASSSEEEPYYPIEVEENKKMRDKYLVEKNKLKNIILGGRLANYKYIDMDQAILSALKIYTEKIKNRKQLKEVTSGE